MDPVGELVAAAVIDSRVWESDGASAVDGVYLVGQPGPALDFVIYRAWKMPVGFVHEEVRLYGPSGKMAYRWGPEVRRMQGAMDLTIEVDTVRDVAFEESGAYLASFIIDDAIVGEIGFPVHVQAAVSKLGRQTEDGLKKSDVIWVGVDVAGRQRTVPAWFAYKDGRIYVLSQREPGPEEQSIPGVPGAKELVVITRHKGRDTSIEEFRAAPRVLQGGEWEEAAKVLVDRRRSRVGPPGDSIGRWRGRCDIVELTPNAPA
jgi:hypothetical protein